MASAAPRQPTPAHPQLRYPSPKLADRAFTLDFDHRLERFGPRHLYTKTTLPAYGTAHPDTTAYSGFRVVFIAPVDGQEGWFRWWFVNDRTAQDDYNAEGDLSGDIEIWRRTYLIRRTEWTAQAEGTADPVVSTRKLINERMERIGDEVLDSLYVQVIRTYANFDTTGGTATQVIPGGDVTLLRETDDEHRIVVYHYRQLVDIADIPLLPACGSLTTNALGSLYANSQHMLWNTTDWASVAARVYQARTSKFESSKKYQLLEVTYGPVPPTRYEYPPIGETFPGIWRYLGAFLESDDDGFDTVKPWAGVHFSLIPPRSASVMGAEEISYHLEGAGTTPPQTFRVISPAAASRFWRDIPQKTVHPAVTIIEINTGGTAVVETFPASTPNTYNYTDVLTVQVSERPWRGSRIVERRIVRISESRSPYTFF